MYVVVVDHRGKKEQGKKRKGRRGKVEVTEDEDEDEDWRETRAGGYQRGKRKKGWGKCNWHGERARNRRRGE